MGIASLIKKLQEGGSFLRNKARTLMSPATQVRNLEEQRSIREDAIKARTLMSPTTKARNQASADFWSLAPAKDYVSQRYVPNAMRKTRTDEGIEFFKKQDDIMSKGVGIGARQLDEIANKKIAEGQALIDQLQKMDPRFASLPAGKKQFQRIASELEDLEKLQRILNIQADLADNAIDARRIMEQAYRAEKVAGLMKGALVAGGAGLGGMYAGAKLQKMNPDFLPDPMETPDEAVDKMMEENFGQKVAGFLIDMISPIPTREDAPNLYTTPSYIREQRNK